jgi:hypothetical protein
VPDGSNWKTTMLIEYPDVDERRRMLGLLKGIERRVWVEVEGCERVAAIADEDLERENDEKTAAVHFLRFELSAASRAPRRGAGVTVGGSSHLAPARCSRNARGLAVDLVGPARFVRSPPTSWTGERRRPGAFRSATGAGPEDRLGPSRWCSLPLRPTAPGWWKPSPPSAARIATWIGPR